MEVKPLNIFQRCIRIWEESHPYNAAQVLEVSGAADVARIQAAWNEALAASGLGKVHVEGGRFHYEPAQEQPVEVVGAEVGLEGHFTRELNRLFGVVRRGEVSAGVPFRAFVVPGRESHHLGLIYQHWVADSISMRMLLRGWFCRLFDPARVGTFEEKLHVPRGGFWRYFGPARTGWNLAEGAGHVIEGMAAFATARRIEEWRGPQEVACSLHRLPDGMVDELRAMTRRMRETGVPVTVNDLFLAALARACDAHGAQPRRCGKDMALGTIVDLRGSAREDLDKTFSLFLGFTSLVVKGGHLEDRRRLLADIAVQNAHLKEVHAAQASMLRMAVGYAQGRFLSREKLAAFYRNYMPFSGGISNVTMQRSWPRQYHPGPLLDYIRVAPTGPMVPLVIAVTTLGPRLTFTLTRRVSLVDAARGRQLAETFIEELHAFLKNA